KLIEIAGDPDPKVQRAAFGYLASKFDELCDTEYDPLKYDDMLFIPAIRDGHECVGTYKEVYSDPSWAFMGFQKVNPSVNRKIDPKEFLRKAGAEGDPEKYLVELCGIAVGCEGLSKEDKKRMKNAPIFISYCTSKSSDPDHAPIVRDKFQLVPASKVLLADDMENCRIFEEFVWFAPQDELLKIPELYESVGSGYLSTHIKHNQGSVHWKWDDKSHFLVKGCKNLEVDKRLDSNYRISAECQRESNELYVSTEITTEENGHVVLWLKKTDHLDMYDVAVALCCLHFKTHKKHNVLSLMTILKMDKEVLRKRGYDAVDRIEQVHKAAKLEDKKKEEERERAARIKQLEEGGGGRHGGGNIRFWSKFLDFFRWQSGGSKTAGKVDVKEIEDAIKELMDQCAKRQATPKEQEI
ncbi:hypothetical protein BDR03DRAFT_1063982, partial [Suillus americanus]